MGSRRVKVWAIGISVALLSVVSARSSSAATITLITETDPAFLTATLEDFTGTFVNASNYNFGNGLSYSNLNGQIDHINYTGGYGLGSAGSTSSGRGGPGDGYFGTGPTPTSFQFLFAGGANVFGFSGAEAVVSFGTLGRNGVLDLEFYDLANTLVATMAVPTAGTFAWNQYHGFASSVMLSRIVFRDVGHMVMDDVRFGATAAVPEPGSIILVGTALLGAGARRWKHRRA